MKRKYWVLSKWPPSDMRIDPDFSLMSDYDGVPVIFGTRKDAREVAADEHEIAGRRWHVARVAVTIEPA